MLDEAQMPCPNVGHNSMLTTLLQWSIVLAGISDFFRPAENLSVTQNFALTCTGLIWTRWCLIIKPRNVLCVPPSAKSIFSLDCLY